MFGKEKITLFVLSVFFAGSFGDCPGGTECPGGCCPIPNAFCCLDNIHCAIQESDCPQKENEFVRAIKPLAMAIERTCVSGTQCNTGCCPLENAFCCPQSEFCATSPSHCPSEDKSFKSAKLRTSDENCPGGTECPSGCCPIEDAFCCPDNIYCALSEKDCPKVKFASMLNSEKRDDCLHGTVCPGGCCPINNAFCCYDNIYCATSPDKCPKKNSLKRILPTINILAEKDNCPGGTECKNGCCPIPNAFCCADGIYCAKTEEKCPKKKNVSRLSSTKKDFCPNGTECPSGCCDIPNAYCCPDNIFCAKTPEDCPSVLI